MYKCGDKMTIHPAEEVSMAIDLENERLVPLHQATKLPTKPTRRMLEKYAEFGVKGRSGKLHFLDVCKPGSVPHTSYEAWQRFTDAFTADSRFGQSLPHLEPKGLSDE